MFSGCIVPFYSTETDLEVATNRLLHQQVKNQDSFSAMSHMEVFSTAISSGVNISKVPGCHLSQQMSSQ